MGDNNSDKPAQHTNRKVKLKYEIKADLENVTDLEPVDGIETFAPVFKVLCTSCRQVHPNWVTVDPTEDRPMQGSRGTAHFVWKCAQCKRAASASIETTYKRSPLTADQSDSHQWATLGVVECRGCEFVEFDAKQVTWKCQGRESGTKFADFE